MKAIPPASLLRGCAVGGVLIAWAWLAHEASVGSGDSDLAVALAGSWLLAVVVLLLWRSGKPCWLIAGGLLTVVAALCGWPALRQNVALLYYLQHAGTHLALGLLFGRSLRSAQPPLVTRFASLAHHGVLSDAQRRYTRQVTVAWTIYFVATAALSTALFLLASPAVWSVFANLLAMPLLCLMFVAEYLVRHRVLPPADRTGIADTVRGYRESMRDRRWLASDR